MNTELVNVFAKNHKAKQLQTMVALPVL